MRKIIFVSLVVFFTFSVSIFGQNSSNGKTVKLFIDAFNKQDSAAMMALVSADVQWFTVSGGKITTETANKQELQTFLDNYFKTCPSCRSKITKLSDSGDNVSFTETATWKSDKGTEVSESFAVYQFENGKIARAYYYGKAAKSTYDANLAKKLGADERGMKMYVFVNLIRGKKQFSKEERDRLVAAHLENIGKLADAKKLVLAGPFGDNNDIRGIYIFDVRTIEEAKKLTETDPAVQAGVFDFEMRLWYGSAALLALDPIHKSLQKKAVTEK